MANREYLSTQAGSIKREHAAITSTGATDANLLVALNADGQIDSDQIPIEVDQGSTTVTGIDCRIGLNNIGERNIAFAKAAVECTEHPQRHTVFQAKGVANTNHRLAQQQIF